MVTNISQIMFIISMIIRIGITLKTIVGIMTNVHMIIAYRLLLTNISITRGVLWRPPGLPDRDPTLALQSIRRVPPATGPHGRRHHGRAGSCGQSREPRIPHKDTP